MKNLTKIFMAVAVAMFAFSCVNNTTEDTVVKVGGKTTLTLSLENTRTQLGEAADGVYPITWSENDQITVNGITSKPLIAADAGNSSATFTFDTESLATPYCIVYPAVAATDKVVFAAEQNHVSNTTFGNGAVTMYGYSEDGKNLTLNHLTGVLKIGVTGSETLACVRISTLDRAPIAGTFDIDFATGKVSATAESSSVITYNINQALSAEPTYIHVAVPAGTYNELYLTLVDANGGVMYKTVKANDEKPLAVGTVREFKSAIEYVAMDATTTFVIKDVESLKAFWSAMDEADAMGDTDALAADAILVADVDMTGETWTSVSGFAGNFVGNGFAIKGLNAPLFGTIGAKSIKGLHLENSTIEQTFNTGTSDVCFGALACEITNPDVKVANCSASGAMTIVGNNPGKHCVVAGLIGKVACDNTTATFTSLINKVNITVGGSFAGASGNYDANIIAGCIGWTNGALTNCQNLGNISSSATYGSGLFMAGITGVSGDIASCVNGMKDNGDKFGKISFTGKATKLAYFGGIFTSGKITNVEDPTKVIDYAKREEVKNCVNYGNMAIGGTHDLDVDKTLYPSIGGIAGVCNAKKLNYCDNYGDITVTMTVVNSKSNSSVAGIGSSSDIGDYNVQTVNNCNNYGAIEIKNAGFAGALHVGGIFNRTSLVLKNVSNLYNEGTITLTNISNVGGDELNVAGVFGSIQVATTASNLENAAKADIVLENVTIAKKLDLGGVIGYIKGGVANVNTAINKGDITLKKVSVGGSSYANIGGITSYNGTAGTVLENLTNEGNIELIDVSANNNFDLGGIMGTITANTTVNGNIKNTGDIYCNAKVLNKATSVAGIIGMYNQQKLTMTEATLFNSGEIRCEGGEYKELSVAGIFGTYNRNNCENATNKGNVIGAVKTDALYVGGIVAGPSATNYIVKNSNCFCDVIGYKWDGKTTGAVTPCANMGMAATISYVKTSKQYVQNCKVGGKIFKSGKVVKNGDEYKLEDVEYNVLSESNYINYIFTNTATDANGCTYWDGK